MCRMLAPPLSRWVAKQWRKRATRFGQISFNPIGRVLGHWHDPIFPPFAPAHSQPSRPQLNVIDLQLPAFPMSDAGVMQYMPAPMEPAEKRQHCNKPVFDRPGRERPVGAMFSLQVNQKGSQV